MSTALVTLTSKLAAAFDMGDGAELITTLKATAFKGDVSDAQMTALLIVANQYRLNPWTKEIYAFPDKKNGIVPVVGVDGWARIINSHPQFDGIEFAYSDELVQMPSASSKAPAWIECRMFRKDRTAPLLCANTWMNATGSLLGSIRASKRFMAIPPEALLRHKATINAPGWLLVSAGFMTRMKPSGSLPSRKRTSPRRPAIPAPSEPIKSC